MRVLYEYVAGTDVHKDMVKVAIRSPGGKPWTRTTEVLEFRTFYGVLQQMACACRYHPSLRVPYRAPISRRCAVSSPEKNLASSVGTLSMTR